MKLKTLRPMDYSVLQTTPTVVEGKMAQVMVDGISLMVLM